MIKIRRRRDKKLINEIKNECAKRDQASRNKDRLFYRDMKEAFTLRGWDAHLELLEQWADKTLWARTGLERVGNRPLPVRRKERT